MSEYLAYVSVSKEDGEAIRDAGLVDARLGGVIEPGASEADFQPDDEPFDLVVRGVRGDHTPARVASARRVYAEIRNRLGLPPCEPRRIGVSPVEGLFDSPRHFALLELAERLRERGEAEFAVVAAQTASEIYVELAIVELLKGQVPVAFAVVKDPASIATAESIARMRKEVMETVNRQLGAIARPDKVHFVSMLPKTRSGKLLRRSIQAIAEGRAPGDMTTIEDPAALEQIRQALAS